MRLIAPNGAAVEASEQAVRGLLAMGFRKQESKRAGKAAKPAPKRAAKGKGE